MGFISLVFVVVARQGRGIFYLIFSCGVFYFSLRRRLHMLYLNMFYRHTVHLYSGTAYIFQMKFIYRLGTKDSCVVRVLG